MKCNPIKLLFWGKNINLASFKFLWKTGFTLDGALRWKVDDCQLERSGSVMWKANTSKIVAPVCVGLGSMGWPPRASIECTDHMPALPPLLQWLCWERNWVCTCGSVSRCAVDWVGSPFSHEQWSCSTLLTTTQKVTMCRPREICMVESHTRTERGMHVVCWSGFPCRVYIDVNYHHSHIWVTACLCPLEHR
jgi:hypothetical protein